MEIELVINVYLNESETISVVFFYSSDAFCSLHR